MSPRECAQLQEQRLGGFDQVIDKLRNAQEFWRANWNFLASMEQKRRKLFVTVTDMHSHSMRRIDEMADRRGRDAEVDDSDEDEKSRSEDDRPHHETAFYADAEVGVKTEGDDDEEDEDTNIDVKAWVHA
jgi:hypothetical protein